LERERNVLLEKWTTARGSEKAKLLVKIMDIDEQLELGRKKEKKKIG
jgi:hypothetical protein